MENIALALLETIRKAFLENLEGSSRAKTLMELIDAGQGTYVDAGDYAEEVGTALAKAFQDNLSADVLPDGKMYWNIAQQVAEPLLEDDYQLCSTAAVQVQQAMNEAAGIGIKAQSAALDEDRVNGILNGITASDNYDDVAWKLNEPVKSFSRTVVDDTLKKNVTFQGKSGLSPKIIRKAPFKCCDWCSALVGTYSYPNVPKDVYRRHENCRCTVEYDPGSGKQQNVWSKKWTDPEENAKIEARKKIGLHTAKSDKSSSEQELAARIANNPSMLKAYTPKGLKTSLENAGYEVKTLGKGKLKGISFEDGGGFRINFEDGGLLTYHPEKGSHHGEAYYKISTGKGGTHRYDVYGREKTD